MKGTVTITFVGGTSKPFPNCTGISYEEGVLTFTDADGANHVWTGANIAGHSVKPTDG